MDHLRIALLGVTAAVAALPFAIARLSAQEHHHPPQHAQIHEQFYSNWKRPDQPHISCCSLVDCAPAEARMVNGQWFARKEGEQHWYPIPPEKIEINRDSPDGRSHLCAMNDRVFCFIVGAGG
jgi:hypothetical protein